MPDQPETWFTTADVEAARQRLADNCYGGPGDLHDLDREDITEIIRVVLTATWQSAVAEGRRQATEGWEREWGYTWGERKAAAWCRSEADARRFAALDLTRTVVSRLVGPWEHASRAEVPEGACLTVQAIARELGVQEDDHHG